MAQADQQTANGQYPRGLTHAQQKSQREHRQAQEERESEAEREKIVHDETNNTQPHQLVECATLYPVVMN